MALSMLWQFANAQVTISKAEYFYDSDPGPGLATAINVASPADTVQLQLNLPTTGLSSGFHSLFVRFKNSNGTWGLHEGRPFYILQTTGITNTAQINAAEYFFDTDPGIGAATAIAVGAPTDTARLALNISTSSLSTGFHTLFIRFRYNNGGWGLYEGRPFYILPTASINNTAKINKAEYFFDNDPGIGNATQVNIPTPTDTANLALNISTTGLSTGFHNLFVRYRYNNGVWGLYEGRPFYIITSAVNNTAQINKAEYFFDTDPGVGNGTQVTVSPATDTSVLALNISTGGLSTGFHNLFVRYRYNNGVWGLYEGRPFYIITSAVHNTAQINKAEYFFDTDPGVGNGTQVSINPTDTAALALSIPTTSLATGFHNLFVRYRYNNGAWGLYEGRPFYIIAGAVHNTAHINGAEYFYDHDPGIGNATSVAVSSTDTARLALNLSVSGLSAGFHNLFIRFKYDNGTWGLYEGRPFYIITSAVHNTAHINKAEYFFDTDPGVGNGTAVTVSPATDTAALVLNGLSAAGLSQGYHYIFFRFRYDNGVWGLYQGARFRICTPPPANITASGSTTYCSGDTVRLTANAGTTYTYQWYRNNVIIAGATQRNYTVHDSSGAYTVMVTDTSGCDSISNPVIVTVAGHLQTNLTQGICQGNSYNFNGRILTTTGIYRDTVLTAHGCDSIIVLNLTVSNQISTNLSASICNGSSYNFNGQVLTVSGTYRDTLQVSGGCDSIVTLTLNVTQTTTTNLSASICNGSSYSFNGQNLTTAGTYRDTLQSSGGCDSIIYVLNLVVNQSVNASISATICAGSSYNFYGQILTIAGTYIDTIPVSGGCDSIVTLTLNINQPSSYSYSITQCGGVYNFNGQLLTTSGTYIDTLQNSAGCDSIITLTLAINGTYRNTLNTVICAGDSVIFDGRVFTSAGVYTDTFSTVNGCDSIMVLNLTLNQPSTTTLNVGICSGNTYTFNGQVLNTTGTYTDTLQNINGCDSIITLSLQVSSVINITINPTICQGQFFEGHGSTGVYVDSSHAVGGCDSITTINLTVTPLTTSIDSQTICDGMVYAGHSVGGVYVDTFAVPGSCDSVRTLYLTVIPAITYQYNQRICQGQSFLGHTTSGTYTDTLTSTITGCDSITIVHLVVNPKDTTYTNASICQGSSYPFHGVSLTTAGTYRDTLTAQLTGCDSFVILTLTVNPLPNVTWPGGPDTVCDKVTPFSLTGGSPTGGVYSGSGVSAGVFSPANAGQGSHVITYSYTDNNGCTDNATHTFVVKVCVGIDELSFDNSIKVYPNPATDVLNIVYELDDALKLNLSITDITGRTVINVSDANYLKGQYHQEVNIAQLASGVYMLHFAGESVNINRRFVKE